MSVFTPVNLELELPNLNKPSLPNIMSSKPALSKTNQPVKVAKRLELSHPSPAGPAGRSSNRDMSNHDQKPQNPYRLHRLAGQRPHPHGLGSSHDSLPKPHNLRYFKSFESLDPDKQPPPHVLESMDKHDLSDKYDLFPTRHHKTKMLQHLADLKSSLEKYEASNIVNGARMFEEILNKFDMLIADDSYYAQVMRKFSLLIKAGIFFDRTQDSNVIHLVHAVNNKNFKSIFFGDFGKSTHQTLLDLLTSVLKIYKKDTDYLEALLDETKDEVKQKEEIITLLTKELKVKDELISKENQDMKDFKTKLDIYEYKNNYDFEGNLIKKSFMENYGQLIKLFDEMKESEMIYRNKSMSQAADIDKLKDKAAKLADVTRRLYVYKEELDNWGTRLVEDFHKLKRGVKDIREAHEAAVKTFEDMKLLRASEVNVQAHFDTKVMSKLGVLQHDHYDAVAKKVNEYVLDKIAKETHAVLSQDSKLRFYSERKIQLPQAAAGTAVGTQQELDASSFRKKKTKKLDSPLPSQRRMKNSSNSIGKSSPARTKKALQIVTPEKSRPETPDNDGKESFKFGANTQKGAAGAVTISPRSPVISNAAPNLSQKSIIALDQKSKKEEIFNDTTQATKKLEVLIAKHFETIDGITNLIGKLEESIVDS